GHRHAVVPDAGDRNLFAGQGEGYEDRALRRPRDAVALGAYGCDGQCLGAHCFLPASRNSWFPSAPVMGEGITPRPRHPPSEFNHASRSAAIFGPIAGSLSRPPLPIASRPASNWGLTSATSQAP